MGSSFGSYEIARSGMYVSERGLFVTGHNISNANTAGFSRQQSIQQTSNYIGNDSNMQYGLGASVQETRQIRHQFLDSVFRKENKDLGKWGAIDKTYIEVQNIIGEPLNDGIQESLNQFWDSWQELSKNPQSLTVRALVRQRGQSFCDFANHLGFQFDSLQANLDNQLVERVNEVNNITTNIAAINEEIVGVEASNDSANDLRDQRNSLLDRLASLINIDVMEKSNGSIDVSTSGYAIVSGKQTLKMLTEDPNNPQMYHAPYFDYKVGGNYIKFTPKSGEISGILESRDRIEKHVSLGVDTGIVPTLNKLIKAIVTEVNEIHNKYGKSLAPPTVDFFEFSTSTKAYGIKQVNINNAINIDLNKITTGYNPTPPALPAFSPAAEVGDNVGALKIAEIRNIKLTSWGNDDYGNVIGKISIDEFYQQKVVLEVGSKAQEASSYTNSQALLVQSIDNQRKSISDVSMDEEMSSMLKYQFAYGGASKAFNTIDEMIDTIINRMGLVGR